MAQAVVKYLAGLTIETENGGHEKLFAGVWAIFGHGNVAGLGEALYQYRDTLPTYRGQNEQSMAHAAIAFAKSLNRRRMMACTSSIGPGATNFVTAAALAHVNRLPVLFLPGDIFVSREPDPVLQQVEDFQDGTVSANDTLRSVSRYFDRIVHPAQVLTALPRAVEVLTNPALCGPVTLAMPQDIQAMAWDYPESFFATRPVKFRKIAPDTEMLKEAADVIRKSKGAAIVAGGGTLFAEATAELKRFVEKHRVPVAETQAGKSSLPWNNELQLGAVGVTGSPAANKVLGSADVVIGVGTRLQDFTTGSNTLLSHAKTITVNVNSHDLTKTEYAVHGDAGLTLDALSGLLGNWKNPEDFSKKAKTEADQWRSRVTEITGDKSPGKLPFDGNVIGAVQRSAKNSDTKDIVVCAAGTLPAELHKLWRASAPNSYHVEYGFSCMGYEIAGGVGVKMAHPDKEVIVMVGDGSYMMMNSELVTSVLLKQKIIVVLQDNRGFGCINRLQGSVGGDPFNNLMENCTGFEENFPWIDFAAHARSMGAVAEFVNNVEELEAAMERARKSKTSYLIEIKTDPARTTEDGGCFWQVGVPEVSEKKEVREARAQSEKAKNKVRS